MGLHAWDSLNIRTLLVYASTNVCEHQRTSEHRFPAASTMPAEYFPLRRVNEFVVNAQQLDSVAQLSAEPES